MIHAEGVPIISQLALGAYYREMNGHYVQVIPMEKVILTAFTDPMMGLSYESEPIMERLRKEYGHILEFRNVMGHLVRDVSDFMTPEERALDPETGIPLYCRCLARIYKSEKSSCQS